MILLHVTKRPPLRMWVNIEIQWLYDLKYILYKRYNICIYYLLKIIFYENDVLILPARMFRGTWSGPSPSITFTLSEIIYKLWNEKRLPVKWEHKKRHQWWMIPPHEVVVRQKGVQLEITQIKIELFRSMMLPENASIESS